LVEKGGEVVDESLVVELRSRDLSIAEATGNVNPSL
jgi:hypothetical protein